MKVIQINGIYEEGQVKLLEPAPIYHSKVIVNFLKEDTQPSRMNEDLFWSIISLLDFTKSDSKEIIRPCINRLLDFEPCDIYQFEEILAEKLFTIDGKLFAESMGNNSSLEKKYFSVDSFLYIRCGAITEGKEFYSQLLQDPTLLSKTEPFEPLLYIAERAYKARTGFDMQPASISYETYSNKLAWTK